MGLETKITNSDLDGVLIGTATYCEAQNIVTLVKRIRDTCGELVDIVIVDDNSPDGTGKIVAEMQLEDRHLILLQRKFRLGLGSAHKLIKQYSVVSGYKKLVTLDADLSHEPEEIPTLVSMCKDNSFVIGSRYIKGGRSDYTGFRRIVSISGNILARVAIGISLRELTTSFRVFDVNVLEKIPLHTIRSNGYGYFIEIIALLHRNNVNLYEKSIHFRDRERGSSKISRLQILFSTVTLIQLSILRLVARKKPRPAIWWTDCPCRLCGTKSLILRYDGLNDFSKLDENLEEQFQSSSVVVESVFPALYDCLSCGYTQIKSDSFGRDLTKYYKGVEDSVYLANNKLKKRTFSRAIKVIEKYFPRKGDICILDVGSYYGLFLRELEIRGYSGLGIEPSQHASEYSRTELKLNVINDSLEGVIDNAEFNKQFDVITTWDVLEHVESPKEFLQQINSLLKPGGVFVFSTIFIDSVIARLLGRNWPWIMPMHVTYFRHFLLLRTLSECGFTMVHRCNHVHFASVRYAVEGLLRSLSPTIYKKINWLVNSLPKPWILPFGLGDVRMYITKKEL